MESDLGKLFIGGISWDTDEERLKEYFRNYGEVVEAVIMRDRATGRARGFGFIVFSDPSVAERVIMDKHIIDGRTVEAKKAVPKDDQQQHVLSRNVIGSSIQGSPGPTRTRKIFVGGLASTVTETDFKTYFDQFGLITDVVVMYDHNTQRPRGFGFITFESEESVDRVLHKTFHELNGKMVEVKRAVPKELSSPSPSRSPFNFNNMGRSSSNTLLSYSPNPIGGFGGVRMTDERFNFNQISSSRNEFSPFGNTSYAMNMGLDQQGLSPTYNTNSITNTLGYARMLSPYYSSNGNRYNTPIGYNVSNGRASSAGSSVARNAWGAGGGTGMNNTNPGLNPDSPGAYLSSWNGNFGVSPNWGHNNTISTHGLGGGSGGDSGFGFGEGNGTGIGNGNGGGYGRNGGTSMTVGYERSYGSEIYRGGDSNWRITMPEELDGPGSFGYGLGIGNIASDVAVKSSDDYIGSYNVTTRQPNRGIAA